MTSRFRICAFTSVLAIVASTNAQAQEVPPPPPVGTAAAPAEAQAAAAQPGARSSDDALGLNDIVVTATRRGQTRLDTSVSVSNLDAATALENAPRGTAELLHNIPGIHVESSGGEGNANISVRGLPQSGGGAKFLQLWEDGLPVLEFGDIAFGNADIFLRGDYNVATIESIRGGSASTLASNSPGGVVNFISKTGDVTGGAIAFTKGLDFGTNRVDADYGRNFGNGWTAHVGGFYRVGEGAHQIGYDGEKGGQIRANITKKFDGGYIRANFKYLNDKAVAYTPIPLSVTGSNGDPTYTSIANFDVRRDGMQSPYARDMASLTLDNRRTTHDLDDGMHPLVKQFGLEGSYEFAKGWVIEDRFKYADVSGSFRGLFPTTLASAQTGANQVGSYLNTGNFASDGTTYLLRFANGPNAGQAINPATLNGNGLATLTTTFDAKINTLDNWINNFKLSKTFDVGRGSVSTQAGYYHSHQEIGITSSWASYLQGVAGNGQSAYLDVYDPAGNKLTQGGQWAYGTPTFGNCCTSQSDVATNIDAFFGSVVADFKPFNIDLSVRHDNGHAKGTFRGNTVLQNLDVDGDGIIEPIERNVPAFNATTQPIDYKAGYWSYSAGLNYLATSDLALFARYSSGGRFNVDRLIPGRILPDGGARYNDIVARVSQGEAGVKYRSHNFGLFLTGFYAATSEVTGESRTDPNSTTNRSYRTYGVEVEGTYRTGGFSINATGTYTHARITADEVFPELVGATPYRQADLIYTVTPQYTHDRFTIGANVVGTTKSYSQNVNQLVMPGFTTVNGFIEARVLPSVTLSVNANNIFNVVGLTEEEDGSITSGITNYVRARSINGRTVSATARLSF